MGAVLAMRALFGTMIAFALVGCQAFLEPGSGAGARTSPMPALSDTVLQVQIPSRGANAPLALVAVNGEVETWMAVDAISLSFRRGVLVASRGLGSDLMGADPGPTLEALAGRQVGPYRRQMRYLTGEHHSSWLLADCIMTRIGAETVLGRNLTRFDEACQTRDHSFTNSFWLDPHGVQHARQWLSPEIGHVATSRAD